MTTEESDFINNNENSPPSKDLVKNDSNNLKNFKNMNFTEKKETVNCEKNVDSEQLILAALKLKEEANEYFKKQDFKKSISLYSEAIDLNPNEPTFYSNRSIAHFKLECYGSAMTDATKSIELNPNFLKGYYRRAITYMALGMFKNALGDFEKLKNLKPSDKLYRDKYNECLKTIKKIAFEKAIRFDEKLFCEMIDLDSIVVDSSYTGPVFEDKITIEFMKELMETFKEGKLIHIKFAYKIILEAQKLFKNLPSLVGIDIKKDSKFTVCGDIHGQYYDLLNIFTLNGLPSENNSYLFNGDFVDRGSFSVECIITLLGFKVLYPNQFHMTRGNHESQIMNQVYGFKAEIISKYTSMMYDLVSEVFKMLPLCYCLNEKVLVMHGGLPKEEVTLDEIRKLNRFREPPSSGLMCDLLWSDPMESMGWVANRRGSGIQFGPDITKKFCEKNNLKYIIRSHEVKMDGYESMHDDYCITVFSAPNYCDTIGNKGAYINLYAPNLNPEFHVYSEVPHPPIKPMAYANSILTSMM